MNSFPLFASTSLSVSEINRYLRDLLDSDDVLSNVWAMGEVSNLSRPASGHMYFTLKDGGSALKCVIWRSTAMRIQFHPQNGMAIEAHGAVSVYERDGQYQLYVDAIRPAGEGLLFQEFLRLKARLEAENLFDPLRKRSLPDRPARIAIVTSPTGAALQDMLNTLRQRYPLCEVLLAPCAVQGEAAPAEICRAIEIACRIGQPDVLIVARGGGSIEDLWAFNDERVVRAIATCPVPVITGVGHETDFTLSDFAADARAPTPTGAAVQATPDRADLVSELHGVTSRLDMALRDHLSACISGLALQRQRLLHSSPARQVQNEQQALDHLQARSTRAMIHSMTLRRARLDGIRSRLVALNPNAILQRGFAIIQQADGKVIRQAADARVGDQIDVVMSDGKISAQVDSVSQNTEPSDSGDS